MSIDVRPVDRTTVYPIRHLILRPNQTIEECEFPGDDHPDTVHYGAYDGDTLVGIASVYRQPPPGEGLTDSWRVRGMATTPARRGQGIGRQLLDACIAHVESREGVLIWCNARTPAVSLYERAGFACVGDEFDLPGIGPHFLMMRRRDDPAPHVEEVVDLRRNRH